MSITIGEENRAFYLGVVYSAFNMSGVAGGIMSVFLLLLVPDYIFILILTIFSILGTIPLLFLENIKDHNATIR
jgi:hypothetical protein